MQKLNGSYAHPCGLFHCNCNLNFVNVRPIVCYVCLSNVSFHIQVRGPSLWKQPFLLALRWGHCARKNICNSATKIPYWWRLHIISDSHGVPKASLFNFKLLLIDVGKVLCSSAKELQQNSNASSREEYIPQILTVLLEIHRIYIWPLWPNVFCVSFVNNS